MYFSKLIALSEDDMQNIVKKYIIQEKLINKGDHIIIGLSGGADSVCLLHMLYCLKNQFGGFSISAIHVHHGLRGEDADKDAEFVQELCNEFGIECGVFFFDIKEEVKKLKMSEEEAGRFIRYSVFEKEIKKYAAGKIAVAHHKNDQVETVLFNLFRGTGLTGLSGMHSKRDNIIRPLLCISREQIEKYININNLKYRNDSTNFLDTYSRNKIRLNIISYIEKEINSNIVEHVYETSCIIKSEEEFIIQYVDKVFEKNVKYKENKYVILIDDMVLEHIAIQKRLIRKIIFTLSNQLKDIQSIHVNKILDLICKPVGKKITLPNKVIVEKSYDSLEFMIRLNNKINNEKNLIEQSLVIPSEQSLPTINKILKTKILNYEKNMIIPKKVYTKWFDYDKIKITLFLRNRQQGDYISIQNNRGTIGRKKLKDYFIDEKISIEQRNNILLLADGKHVVWIVGYRISEDYKVTNETKRVLQVTIMDR